MGPGLRLWRTITSHLLLRIVPLGAGLGGLYGLGIIVVVLVLLQPTLQTPGTQVEPIFYGSVGISVVKPIYRFITQYSVIERMPSLPRIGQYLQEDIALLSRSPRNSLEIPKR